MPSAVVTSIVRSAVGMTGQACQSLERVYVQAAVYPAFREKVAVFYVASKLLSDVLLSQILERGAAVNRHANHAAAEDHLLVDEALEFKLGPFVETNTFRLRGDDEP